MIFELLYKNYSQTKILIDNLNEVLILESKEVLNDLGEIRTIITKMNNLSESSEDWYPYCDSQAYSKIADEMITQFN